MLRSLLFGAIVLVLASGGAGASAAAANRQPVLLALDQRAQAAFPGVALTEGRSAFTYDNGDRPDGGDQAPAAERREVGKTFHENLMIVARNVFLLAIASLVFGLGAIGAKALWVLDDTESSSHGWPRGFGR